MSSNAEMNGSRRHIRRGVVVVAAVLAGGLLAGCGSGGGDQAAPTTTVKAAAPAGAKENAATAPVCYDLYKPTVQVGCAENTIGPGGGVIFYDADLRAGGTQAWGRFLEVAPQKWNVNLYDCPNSVLFGSSCGAATGTGVEKKTSDLYETDNGQLGWRACNIGGGVSDSNNYPKMPGSSASLSKDIGTGRANTDAMLAVAACTGPNPGGAESGWSAFQKAANFATAGATDWFVPSEGELLALCRFGNRNAIGGFPDKWFYLSSTTTTSDATYWTRIRFDSGCTIERTAFGTDGNTTNLQGDSLTRPIRAF